MADGILTQVRSTSTSFTIECTHWVPNGTRIYWDYLAGAPNVQWLNRGYTVAGYNVPSQFTYTNMSGGYFIRARIINGSVSSLPQVGEIVGTAIADGSGSGTPTPSPPSTPTISYSEGTSTSEVYFSWNSVSNAYGYEFELSGYGSRTTSSTYIYWGNLGSGSYYQGRVRAYNSNYDYSGWSSWKGVYTQSPPVPSTPSISGGWGSSYTEIYVYWNSVNNANGYNVYIEGVGTKSTTSTSIYWGELQSGTTYKVQVQAYNNYGNSNWSSQYSVTTQNFTLTTPSAPKVTGNTPKELVITWNAVTNASRYNVGMYNSSTTNSTTGTTYYWGNLSAGTSYGIRIQAYNDTYSKASDWSSYTYGSTKSFDPPTNFKMVSYSSTELTLSWDAVSGASSYEVQMTSGTSGTKTFTTTSNNYWTGLSPNTSYTARVRAYSSTYSIYSSYSTTFTARTLQQTTPPNNFRMSADTNTQLYLVWDAVSGATNYEVALYNSSGFSQSRQTGNSNASYYWNGLTADTSYSGYVKAYTTAGGWSNQSNNASARTLSNKTSAPANFTITASSSRELHMKWDVVSGATKYQVAIYSPISASREVSTNSIYWGELEPNTLYYAYVKAYSSSGDWSDQTSASGRTNQLTAAPTGFTMTTSSSTEIKMSWNAVANATAYQVSIYSPFSESRTAPTNPFYWGNLTPNTTYYGYVKAFTTAGDWSNPSTADSATTSGSRPTNFAWTYAKSSGGQYNLTANEWNALCNKINEFRAYKSLTTFSFTSANTNGTFYAEQHYNQAVRAINAMTPSTSVPSTRATGNIIYANDLNRLRDSLNSIT